MSNFKTPLIRSEKHRRFIASLPCAVSGLGQCQAAHIRTGCYSAGMKPCDSLTIPLNYIRHLLQHDIGEEKFYYPYGGIESAKELAKKLYEHSGDYDVCNDLVKRFRMGMFRKINITFIV